MKITLISAMQTFDSGIGKDGEIPWHIPEELEHFKEETYNHPVIMGRKTFENTVDQLGEPLPGRLNIVLTTSDSYGFKDVVTARNKQAALEAAEDSFSDEVYVAGGASVYEQFLDDADRMVLSMVRRDFDCDTFFPEFTALNWDYRTGEEYEDFTVVNLERRR